MGSKTRIEVVQQLSCLCEIHGVVKGDSFMGSSLGVIALKNSNNRKLAYTVKFYHGNIPWNYKT